MSSNGGGAVPHNIHAEQQVLGAIIENGTATIPSVLAHVREEDFFYQKHRAIFRSMLRIWQQDEQVDKVTLPAELVRAGLVDEAGGMPYVRTLSSELIARTNAPTHARIVGEQSQRRHQLRILKEATLRVEGGEVLGLDSLQPLGLTWWEKSEIGGSLPIRTLSEAMLNVPSAPPWIVHHIVAPETVTLIGGAPKVGKSTLECAILGAIDRAEPILGLTTRSVGWLLLSEERIGTLAPKIERWQLDLDRNHVLMHHETRGRSWADIPGIAADYAEAHDLGLIVVDTLGKWAGLRGDDENQSGAMMAAVEPLLEIAGEGFAVVIIHHHRKSGGSHGDAMRGSNALTASVDIILDVERAKASPNARRLTITSRFDAAPSEPLHATLTDTYQLAAPDETDAEHVIAICTDQPGITIEEVSTKLGISESTTRRSVDYLIERGQLREEGKGVRNDPKRFYVK